MGELTGTHGVLRSVPPPLMHKKRVSPCHAQIFWENGWESLSLASFFGIFWLFEFHGFSMVFMELRRTGDGRLGLPMTAWNMKFVEGCGVQASKEWGKKMITTCHRMSSPFQLSLLVWLWHVMKTLPSSHSVSVSRHGLHSSISVCFRWLKIGRNCINKNAFGRLNGNFSTCVHFQSSRHHSSRHRCDCWVFRRPWVKWTGHVGEL